jgi:hypothetical protein
MARQMPIAEPKCRNQSQEMGLHLKFIEPTLFDMGMDYLIGYKTTLVDIEMFLLTLALNTWESRCWRQHDIRVS